MRRNLIELVTPSVVALTVLLTCLLGAWTGAAFGAEPRGRANVIAPQACDTNVWVGIVDYDDQLPPGNLNYLKVREAMQVHYNANCDADFIRGYQAVTCRHAGQNYPCSYDWTIRMPGVTNSGTVSNTGSDGFASNYGSWRAFTQCDYRSDAWIIDFGLAGTHYSGTFGGDSGTWSYC